jgi:hypothetical protein
MNTRQLHQHRRGTGPPGAQRGMKCSYVYIFLDSDHDSDLEPIGTRFPRDDDDDDDDDDGAREAIIQGRRQNIGNT